MQEEGERMICHQPYFMDKETKAKLFKAGVSMEVIYALEVCKA